MCSGVDDVDDATDEWMSLSALTGHWTTSTPFETGIEPTGLAYAEGRNLVYAVAPSGTNLNDLFSITRYQIPHEIELSSQIADGTTCTASEGALRQALLNLAGNANKFTEQGTVIIAARAQPLDGSDTIEIAVSSGVRAPMSRPIGDRIRAKPSSSTPASRSRLTRSSWVRRLPITPM